jgi:hypothetical protein
MEYVVPVGRNVMVGMAVGYDGRGKKERIN